jgi:arylsulfatase A-like enzyme
MIRYDIPGHVMHKSPQLAIREGQYKLLLNPDQTRVELYDILADPREMNNLASQYPKVVAKMSEKLSTGRRHCLIVR